MQPAPKNESDRTPPESATSPTLRASIRKHLAGKNQELHLEVDFEAAAGFTIVFGPSGVGKTTLLNCVAGLTTPDSGQVTIGTRVLFDPALRIDICTAKRRVGYVFQDAALFPHMTVEENVQYGLSRHTREARTERSKKILQAFRIAHLASRSAHQISGGESQRTALARTLVTDPDILLLDEPLAALDSPTKSKIIDDLRDWNRAHQIPILYVTHSREEVFALGERVIVLDAGRIAATGTPHEVLTAPRQETVAQLAGFENIFDAKVAEIHPERGTMLCTITSRVLHEQGTPGDVVLETPLVRAQVGSMFRVGIGAGDILLATARPTGLSARNIISGRVVAIEQRDVIVSARIDCGVEMEVHLTLAARDSLQLVAGQQVWLVIKTHSCHLMRAES